MAFSEVVKLAVDMYNNRVDTKFTTGDMQKDMDVLRQALIDANGGSTELSYKKVRDNPQIFQIIEEILENTILEGFKDNPFFERFVEYRNLKLGDKNSFHVPDNSLFVVADTAEGINGVRRQRINKGSNETIPTQLKTVSVYEDANMLLAGRIDLLEFLDRIEKSFTNKRGTDIYTTFYNGINSINAAFKENGAFVEDSLLDIIDHVEAATGNTAYIVGTRKSLRKVTTAVVSDSLKENYNAMGYYGNFNGTEMIMIPQVHAVGTYNFLITDADIWVVTSETKPVKFVTEGDVIMEQGRMTDNADFTVDIFAGERYGVGLVMDSVWGQYRIA